MTHFPKDIPSDILSRADELLSAKYGTDRPIDPEIVELVCRGMMEERELTERKKLVEFSDPDRQFVYALLCDTPDGFPDGEHWASYIARKVDEHYKAVIAKAIRGTE